MVLNDQVDWYKGKEVEIKCVTTFENGSTPVITWDLKQDTATITGTCRPKDLRHPFTKRGLEQYVMGDFEQVDDIKGFQHIDRFLAPIMDGWHGCESEIIEKDDPAAYMEWIDMCEAHCGVSDVLIDLDTKTRHELLARAYEVYDVDTK
jgi:hypothetical protein